MNETVIKSFAYLAFAKDLKKQGKPFCHEHFMKIQKLILTYLGKALLKFLKHFLKSKYFGSFMLFHRSRRPAEEGRLQQMRAEWNKWKSKFQIKTNVRTKWVTCSIISPKHQKLLQTRCLRRTVFENQWKSRIQHCERSEQYLYFWVAN